MPKKRTRTRRRKKRIRKGRFAYIWRMRNQRRRPRPKRDNKNWIVALLAGALVVIAIVGLATPKGEQALLDKDGNIRIQVLSDREIQVYNHREKEVETMNLEEYIACTVAGEMPASYEEEALKAQAVAARTYVARKMNAGGCNQAEGADVCTSSAHCQAFCSLEDMKEKWGDDFTANYEKIASAVMDTAGEILTYDGKPIEALYFASSGGQTEDAQNVFSNAQPYLVSVDSPGEGEMGRNEEDKTFTKTEFLQLLKESGYSTGLDEESLQKGIEILSRYDSGRVEKIRIGEAELTGREMREVFTLNSTNFTLGFSGDTVVVHTKGFGHGVGMSQAGANAMAQEGATYQEILTHYYTGVELSPLDE